MHYQDLTDEALEDRIATLSVLISAATYQLLCLVAEYDRRQAWADPLDEGGFRSAAHWLAWRTGLSNATARQYVRVARALPGLPQISAAFAGGGISWSKVRAITRVATPENERMLLRWAETSSAAQLERVVRQFRRNHPAVEREQAAAQRQGRRLVTWFDSDGMLVVQGRLAPEQGALLMKALEVAGDELRGGSAEPLDAATGEVTGDQLRADALARVAELALTGGSAEPGTDRYQVVVHVDAEVLADPAADGRCELEEGPRLAPDVARRMACDGSTVEMVHGPEGGITAGRKTRVLSTTLRRALRARDGTRCAFPGCQCRARDAHHIRHWADGGATALGNLVGLCRAHHTLVHEGGFAVEVLSDGAVRFVRPDGQELRQAPSLPVVEGGSAEPLLLERLPVGADLERAAAPPAWLHGDRDYDWAVAYLTEACGREVSESAGYG